MSTTTTPSSDAIRGGQREAERELEDANAAHARAAYAYATNKGDDTRQALIQAKQRMDVLAGELQGLSAAVSEAERVEAIEACDRQLKDLDSAQAEADELLAQMRAAWSALDKSIRAMGERYRALMDLQRRTDRAVRALYIRSGAEVHAFLDHNFHLEGQIGGLIWEAVGQKIDVDISTTIRSKGADKDPEAAARMIEPACEAARRRVAEGVARSRKEIEARRQRYERAA